MIEIQNLSKRFEELEVLKNISLTINDGEIFGIIGQSGAGKSTLLRCINGLESYQEGEVRVNGQLIDTNDKESLRVIQKDMGMIFQSFNLLSRADVYENVALPLHFAGKNPKSPENDQRIRELIEMVGLSDKIHSLPRELSGGQQQRVAIARALVLNPSILLCDEATSALDPATTKEILSLLARINHEMGITIVIVTHQMEVIKQTCDRVAFIKNGDVLAIGRPEELFLSSDDDIKEFLGESFENLPKEGINIQLFFMDDTSNEPVITSLARNLNIDFSICYGKLENFKDNILGSLVINIDKRDLERVMQFLKERNVYLEVLDERSN